MATFPTQGGNRDTWGTDLRTFFAQTYDLSAGYQTSPAIDIRAYGASAVATVSGNTTAIQNALNACPSYGAVSLAGMSWTINAQITIPNNNIVFENGKLTAAAGANFEYMLLGTSRTGCVVRNMDLDANKANRSSGQNVRFMGAAFLSSTDCAFINVTARNCRGYGGISAVGLGIAGGSTRGRLQHCTLIDCGDSGFDADGIFTSGDQNVIASCTAYNCTDTGFVIESSNHSVISGCTAYNCSAPAAITNASGDDKYGNIINGLTGRTNLTGSTGQIQIGVPGATAGNLYDTEVSNVSLYKPVGVSGTGPAIYVRKSGGGKAIGVSIDNVRINGSTSQGILVDGDEVSITSASIKNSTDACIQFQTGSIRGYVSDCNLIGGSYGITTNGTSDAISKNNVCRNQTNYGLYAFGTSVLTSIFDTVKSPTVDYFGKDAGATVDFAGQIPSVSSDRGDAGVTLTVATVSPTQRWNTPLTADRAVTLSTASAFTGAKFKIVRTAAATGAFNLNVGTGPLKALAAGTWCEVEYNGSAWMLTGYGTL